MNKKWEYKILKLSGHIEENALAQLGEDGWELCGVTQASFYSPVWHSFKRELVSKPEKEKI